MKSLKYILLGIFIICVIFSCNSQTTTDKFNQEFVLKGEGTFTKAQLSASKEIVSNRLKTLQINHFEIIQNDAKSQLTVKFNDSLNLQALHDVLTAKGDISFHLALGRKEVITALQKVDPKMLMENHKSITNILSLLETKGNTPDSNPVIGLVDFKDTSIVSKCLNSKTVKSQWPEDIKFVWQKNADHLNKFALYAIFTNNPIGGNMINDASVSEITPSKITDVNIAFNSDGSARWKEVTSKNIGKAIAMVIDNKVYSAPIVRSEINNGKCAISGNYTAQEAKCLVAILKNGKLPLSFQLVK